MGNLLKVLACAELEHGPIVFLDFERETIRFLFFWVIPFSLLPLLCFPHSIDLSWPLCHLYVLIYPFLPPQLYSSSPSLFLFWFPLQGLAFESHLASFLKGLIHTRHILLGADRCTMAWWRHNKMTTIMLWSRLISYKKKPRRNKTECQSCVGFCCSEMMMANRSLSSSSTSSSPHPLLCDLLCVWPIRVWVSVRQIMCVWESEKNWKKERLWRRLVNQTTSNIPPPLFSFPSQWFLNFAVWRCPSQQVIELKRSGLKSRWAKC